MINEQAAATGKIAGTLLDWLESRSQEDYQRLLERMREADQSRLDMEKHLIEAFATPFDRSEIYSISIQMSRIAIYAQSTLLEMESFSVAADTTIRHMVKNLLDGVEQLARTIYLLREDARRAEDQIGGIRQAQTLVEGYYRAGMRKLFEGQDLLRAMKYREVYHHIKDAATFLGYTTDVLHRIIVRLI
ncbi:MAG TPA: DUF47 domain-containing protein [Desulfotomaculum sp.]|nr:DUF47 domain-containing protein [Desulfotomaculum sp.]HBY03638.1 DUF47 domain-containing protein [Desulfotomaculum sp.]